jgi:hypothetical protein
LAVLNDPDEDFVPIEVVEEKYGLGRSQERSGRVEGANAERRWSGKAGRRGSRVSRRSERSFRVPVTLEPQTS